jgi:hypothetical protein
MIQLKIRKDLNTYFNLMRVSEMTSGFLLPLMTGSGE